MKPTDNTDTTATTTTDVDTTVQKQPKKRTTPSKKPNRTGHQTYIRRLAKERYPTMVLTEKFVAEMDGVAADIIARVCAGAKTVMESKQRPKKTMASSDVSEALEIFASKKIVDVMRKAGYEASHRYHAEQ